MHRLPNSEAPPPTAQPSWVAVDELSEEEIMRDEDLARHAFHQVGTYDGPTVFLYNEYANGIRHRDQLNRILKENEYLWIVPADVHF